MQPPILYDDLRAYCHVKGLYVQFGSSQSGFLTVDGDGIIPDRSHTSFPPAGEMIGTRSPRQVLPEASMFRIMRKDDGSVRELTRADFAAELIEFLKLLKGEPLKGRKA